MSLQSKVGEWSIYRHLTPEDRALFDKVMKSIVGVGYDPLSVSTQIVNGTNYKFRVIGTIIIPDMPQFNAIVKIHQPIEGEPVLRSITDE